MGPPAEVATVRFRDGGKAKRRGGNPRGTEKPLAASPPDDSYSRTSNLDRFEHLHTVAGALIDHLADTYAVTVTPVAADDTARRHTTNTMLTVTPESADAAPLLLRFTDFPAVEVTAGITHHVAYPDCGCDACDETWEDAADDLETLVLAVAAGTFNEQIHPPHPLGHHGREGDGAPSTRGAGRLLPRVERALDHVDRRAPRRRSTALRAPGPTLATLDTPVTPRCSPSSSRQSQRRLRRTVDSCPTAAC
ncbi:hypothetical protein GCM10023147_28190 [Tsukamurella soli]|uniref:Uncharacterized protein n=1 Tax=Tsukamurella soli TaxID=644556 RepID=A0ABP8JS76_9ACTN